MILGVGLAGLAAAAFVVIAIATGLLLNDTTRPVSVEEIVRRFHAGTVRPDELEGVYVYRTSGRESIDALGGALHRYPGETTITVRKTSCGIELRWQPLEGRATTWTMCPTASGPELTVNAEEHTFFGSDDTTTYACKGSVIGTTRRSFTCTSDRGVEHGTIAPQGSTVVTVGRAGLPVLHATSVARVSGGDKGTETVEWWLDPHTGLPARIVLTSATSRKVLLRPVHYREQARLELVSLVPRR